ncbi:hypothetical protein FOA52_013037 [Chlamydomonas sp. UWO 241]|nr:hypothetical protein FOA52_013037 [Chlamydomonas sp. UWO 241]
MRLTLHSAISRPIGGHAVVGGQRCVCAPFRAVGAPLRAVDSTTDATPLSPDGAYSSDVGTLGGYESSFEEEEREKARRKLRPLVPTIDTNQLVEVLFGTSGGQPKAGGVSAELEWLFRMKENMGTSPRLYSPRVAIPPGTPPASTLPLLVYLPGLDGTGLAAYRQFPSLRARFDLRALFIPPDDRSSFEGLVEHVQALLSAEALSADPSRPIYLLGESFGGVLALVLASRCDFVDRIIIVNPATSFADSPWPALGPILTQLPAQLYATLPIALSPVLANPITMAMHNMDSTDPVPRQISDVAYGLIDMLTELNALRVALPPATLAHRLSLLKEGAEFVIDKRVLGAVPQRTLLLVGQLDLVVPSNAEGPRIVKEMQRCRLRVLQLRAHAMLQEAGVSLVDIMDEEGFYQATRLLSSGTSSSDTMPTTTTPTSSGDSDTESHATSSSTAPPAHTAHSADNGSAPTAAAASSRTPVVMAVTAAPPPPPPPRARPAKGGATFGTAAPLQMPTMRELDKAMETGSPSFQGWDHAAGTADSPTTPQNALTTTDAHTPSELSNPGTGFADYGGHSTHESPAFVTRKGKGSMIEAIKIRKASAGIGQRITRSITRSMSLEQLPPSGPGLPNAGIQIGYMIDGKLYTPESRKDFLTTILPLLLYADDIALLAPSEEDLRTMLTLLDRICSDLALAINYNKTVAQSLGHPSAHTVTSAPITIPSNSSSTPHLVHSTSKFKYLGSILSSPAAPSDDAPNTSDSDILDSEISRRIGSACAALFAYRRPDMTSLFAGGAITSYRLSAGDFFAHSVKFRSSANTHFSNFKRDISKHPEFMDLLSKQTGGLNVLERLVSPVFFSTQADGRVVRGLGAIPDDRPILFVGNHQLFAPDMPLMVAQFLREKKTLLRGLAHPIAVGGPGAASAAGPATASGGGGASGAAAGGDGGGAAARGAGAGSFGAFLKTFGAVPVSGSNLYRLLAQGESVLLYPGGAREANKRRGEKYALLWPRKQEFVRMAARLGATIIPFAAIGAEDSINIMADSDAVLDLPVVGPMLRQRMKDAEPATIPAARRGVNALSADEANLQETFSVPFITPNAPARFYFVFRRPIQTSPALASDRAACDTLYATVKGECEGGLSYLLRKRLQDPYADFGQRMLWEGIRGFREQAPTFEP